MCVCNRLSPARLSEDNYRNRCCAINRNRLSAMSVVVKTWINYLTRGLYVKLRPLNRGSRLIRKRGINSSAAISTRKFSCIVNSSTLFIPAVFSCLEQT